MNKHYLILCVDDEREVLDAVIHDLARSVPTSNWKPPRASMRRVRWWRSGSATATSWR